MKAPTHKTQKLRPVSSQVVITSACKSRDPYITNLQPPLHPSSQQTEPWVTNLPPINREVKAHHYRIVLGVEIEGVEIHGPNLTTRNAWLHMAA